MHSLSLLLGAVLASGALAVVPPAPIITPGPDAASIEAVKRDGPDAISLANVLLTAVPASLRAIAATNIPAVSKILWSEFLDNNTPSWFTALPTDVQSYLVHEFGPKTSVSASTTQSTSQSQSTSPSSSQSRTTSSAESSSSLSSAATRSASDTTAGLPIAAPSASHSTNTHPVKSGLSKGEKIGIGVGVALAILAILALVAGCCLLLRRRRRRRDFSTPPSSPGFIPRSAFHEKSAADDWSPHRPLHGDGALSAADLNRSELDGDTVYDDTPSSRVPNGHQPIMAPAVFHSHSSNRARGKRTSYTSLHSVPEIPESDPVSPVTPRASPPRRSLINPEVAAVPQVKRKPVPKAEEFGTNNGALFPNANGHNRNASDLASQRLFQQHMGHNAGNRSPTEERNPFGNQYSYEEDYGPEYHNGYKDLEVGQPVHPAFRQPTLENSRTEWPLQSVGTNGRQRNKSPLWDRVYDGT